MNFKIDTKEKMHVITLEEAKLAGNMTAELQSFLLSFLDKEVKNLVIKMDTIQVIDVEIAKELASVQQLYYEKNQSLVYCGFQKGVEQFLEELELLEIMNITPTESEAWDIVQMEEIEREFL